MTARVHVRRATHEDSPLLLAWRNDPVTRAASVNSDVVAPEDHDAWFAKVVDSPQHRLLIGLDLDDVPAGMVRFDLRSSTVWEVSINVAPERRGHGVGGDLLAAGLESFAHEQPQVALIARVHHDNAASNALFARAGFTPEHDGTQEDGFVRLRRGTGPTG